ncbi:MAG: C-terminal binding protein [Candidatus Omnitrophica bacterium]|nr:C-terminal binding protein [Candidatus Omnitrophota bacterium]
MTPPLKVVVTDYTFASLETEAQILKPLGCDFVGRQCKSEQELIDLVADADVVVTQFAPLTPPVINAMSKARVIIRYGIGVDNVNLPAATEKGIPVCNVPDYCIDEVADHTLSMMLSLTRQIPQISNRVRAGKWRTALDLSKMRVLKALTVGIVGFGRIGREVVQRLRPFKCAIMAFDPVVPAGDMAAMGVKASDLPALFQASDIISLHCPSTPQTKNLINRDTLAQMKRGVIILNLSRGNVINQDDLIQGLQEGKVGGTALDVTVPEPINGDSPLLEMENVIITNHVASCSALAVHRLRKQVAETVIVALRGEKLPNVVNPQALKKQ